MNKPVAFILLVIYLSFLGGAYGKIQEGIPHHLCSNEEKDESAGNGKCKCYQQALLHHIKSPVQTPSNYKYKFSPALTTENIVALMSYRHKAAYDLSEQRNPLIFRSIYLKNRVLRI